MEALINPEITWDKDGLVITRLYKCSAKTILEDELLCDRVYDYFELKNGKTYVDVGASIGIWTCDVSSRVGSSVIYSVEPHPDTYKNLEYNANVNKNTNTIIPIEAGFAEKDDVGGFEFIGFQHNSYYNSDVSNNAKVMSWDTFVDAYDIKNVYLLKVDIEGAEESMFKGMTKCLPERIAFASYHHDQRKSLHGLLRQKGYTIVHKSKHGMAISFAILSDVLKKEVD